MRINDKTDVFVYATKQVGDISRLQIESRHDILRRYIQGMVLYASDGDDDALDNWIDACLDEQMMDDLWSWLEGDAVSAEEEESWHTPLVREWPEVLPAGKDGILRMPNTEE